MTRLNTVCKYRYLNKLRSCWRYFNLKKLSMEESENQEILSSYIWHWRHGLSVIESRRRFVFNPDVPSDHHVWKRAAEKFFISEKVQSWSKQKTLKSKEVTWAYNHIFCKETIGLSEIKKKAWRMPLLHFLDWFKASRIT